MCGSKLVFVDREEESDRAIADVLIVMVFNCQKCPSNTLWYKRCDQEEGLLKGEKREECTDI